MTNPTRILVDLLTPSNAQTWACAPRPVLAQVLARLITHGHIHELRASRRSLEVVLELEADVYDLRRIVATELAGEVVVDVNSVVDVEQGKHCATEVGAVGYRCRKAGCTCKRSPFMGVAAGPVVGAIEAIPVPSMALRAYVALERAAVEETDSETIADMAECSAIVWARLTDEERRTLNDRRPTATAETFERRRHAVG